MYISNHMNICSKILYIIKLDNKGFMYWAEN